MYIKLKKVGNITIGFNLSLLLVSVVIGWYLSSISISSEFGNLGGFERGLIIFVGISVFIISIVLHEMAHFIVAKMLGIELRRFIFSVTDGLMFADLYQASTKPTDVSRRTFKIAVAGPLVSFALASLFATSWWLESQDMITEIFPQKNSIILVLYYAALGNFIFALVNLIPAFPCDGVLILTAFLERRSKNRQTLGFGDSLRVMYVSGFAIIFCCFAAGCYLLFSNAFLNGLWLILAVWIVGSDVIPFLGRRPD